MIKLNELNQYMGKQGVIYLITNKFNGKRFVGASATNIIEEFNSLLESQEGELLRNAIEKYNNSAFTVEILEENKPEKLLKGFINYYIIKYKSLFSDGEGYNILIKEPLENPNKAEIKPKYYIIKDNRVRFYFNYDEIAADLGVSVSTIEKIFAGVIKNSRCEAIGRIKEEKFVEVKYKGNKYRVDKEINRRNKKNFDTREKIKVNSYNLGVIKSADISKWLDKELLKEDRAVIAAELNLKTLGKAAGSWNTVKKYLILSDLYEVIDSNIMIYGERISISKIIKK